MKGHLGFRCRGCLPPGPVQNLRQSGTGFVSSSIEGTLAWDAPASAGSCPILGYRVEQLVGSAWNLVADNSVENRTYSTSWCDTSPILRVAAYNACGVGGYLTFSGWVITGGSPSILYTNTQTISLPCWASTMKAWCIGPGGQYSGGGAGGAIAWRSWTRNSSTLQWPGSATSATVTVRNSIGTGGEPTLASVTLNGQTVTAYGATNASLGSTPGTHDGGDGGRNGGPSYGTNSLTFQLPAWETRTYSGQAYWGGSAGGEGDTGLPSRAVSPCKRIPLDPTYFSDLTIAIEQAGGDSPETCHPTIAAVGSGGVRLLTDGATLYGQLVFNPETGMFDEVPPSMTASGDTYFTAGYGGGGFDATRPGGPGCVVVKFS